MKKILAVGLAVLIAFLILAIVILPLKKSEKSDILEKIKLKTEKLDNFRAYIQSKKVQNGCSVVYEFTLDIIKSKRIIRFKDLKYANCSTPEVYEALKKAISNATLIDMGSYYYLYTPAIKETENSLVKYKAMDSIIKYKFIPIIDCLAIANTFDHASNLTASGEKISYDYKDRYLGETHLTLWVDENYIPVKIKADFINQKVIIESEVKNYKFGNAEDFNMDNYTVIER